MNAQTAQTAQTAKYSANCEIMRKLRKLQNIAQTAQQGSAGGTWQRYLRDGASTMLDFPAMARGSARSFACERGCEAVSHGMP